MFRGIFTALVTPLKDGKIDEECLGNLVDWQIDNGIHGLVPSGTTGESATLSHEEHGQVIDIVVKRAAGRVPVVAGTGSNSTWEAIELTKHAKEAGADASLQITPYYNRPTQEGLYRHFEAVAKEVDIPIILYNVPGRTGVNMQPETVARLSKIDNIVGLKDAAGSVKQTLDTVTACGDNFAVLSGDDFANLSVLVSGGTGAISVSANVAPRPLVDFYQAWEAGEIKKACEAQRKLHELNRCMFLETNPIPVKYAVHLLGLCGDEIRPPMTVLDEKFRPRLKQALQELGLM